MLPGLDFESLPGGKEDRKGHELFCPQQVVEGFGRDSFKISALVSELRGYALQTCWRDRPRALNACSPASNINPKTCQAVFPMIIIGEKKPQPTGFAEGSVNPDSSTDRNPDRSSSDDRTGSTYATDIRPGGGNSGSAGSPRDGPGRCKCGSLHPVWIRRVPKQPVRVLPVLKAEIFSYQLFGGQTPMGSLLTLLPCQDQAAP